MRQFSDLDLDLARGKLYFHFVYKLFNHVTVWRIHIICCKERVVHFAREKWYVQFVYQFLSHVSTLYVFDFVLIIAPIST